MKDVFVEVDALVEVVVSGFGKVHFFVWLLSLVYKPTKEEERS